MKHTFLNQRKLANYRADITHENSPAFPKTPYLPMLRYLGIFLVFCLSTTFLAAQNPVTGSGASAILDFYDFGINQPDITDPCTCAGAVNGVEIFNDEIIVESKSPINLVLDVSASTGVLMRNSATAFLLNTPIPFLTTGIDTSTTPNTTVYIYVLPIAHESGVGYSASIIPADPNVTLDAPLEVANTCSKVDVDFRLVDVIDANCADGSTDGIPDISLGSTQTINIDVFNKHQNSINLLAGNVIPNEGESASIYIGSVGNEQKILVDRLESGDAIPSTGIYDIVFDPAGALATGGFNPLVDTLITFVYDADTSAMSKMYGALTYDATDPGCSADAATIVNWNTCGDLNYRVGSTSQKYDNEERTFILCPCDPNKQMMKVDFTRFDIRAGDILTIYEGIGTSGDIREQLTTGGTSAANALSATWYQARCDNDSGCLTIVFSPDENEYNNGLGFDFLTTCEDRETVVTCPVDVTIPSTCDINHSNSIAALYTISAPGATCNYEPVIMSTIGIINTAGTAIVLDAKNTKEELIETGDFLDDGDGNLEVGETIFLLMGEYSFSYTYMPIPNTTPLPSCEFKVRVDEIAPVCNNQVNISLNTATCSAQLNADMMIEGDDCWLGYTLNILDGVDAGTDIITYANVGKKIRVEAVTPQGNKCWGYILVEDKAPPTFICQDIAVYCGVNLNPDISNLYPTDGEDCTSFKFEFVDGPVSKYGCNDARKGNGADTIGVQQRMWTAIDAGGARSETCVQNIYRLRPHLTIGNIVWPGDTTFYCEDNPDKNFLPTITGYPQVNINGQLINLETTCLFGIDYKDTDFTTDCEGVVKKGRIWTILDWCGSGSGSGLSVLQSDTQLIKMIDTIAPVLTGEPITLEHFSSHGACSAHVIFPAITVTDACTPSTSYKVQGPLSTIFHTVGSTVPDTMWNVPFGTYDFVYIGEDDCGNQTRHTINKEIKDFISPTAIARELSVSLVADDQLTWVYATSFDGGSHDNCGVTSVLARKLGEVTFTDAVGFTCEDIPNDSLMVEIQVMDECGNTSLAMGRVTVSDKLGVCDCNMTTEIVVTETSGSTNNDRIICEGESAVITATGGVGYVWSTAATTNFITVTTGGIYTVTISDALGCTVEKPTTIEATDLPVAMITTVESSGIANDGQICAGETATLVAGGGNSYLWSTGETTPSIIVNAAGIYTVTATNGSNCKNTANATIIINALPMAAITTTESSGTANDGNICDGTTATLTASGGVSYLWSTGGITDVISVATAGTYIVTVTDANGCTASQSMSIVVDALPSRAVMITETSGTTANDGIICTGATATLTATDGVSYNWSTTEVTAAINISTAGVYVVTITNGNGCTKMESISIKENGLPTPAITVAETSGTMDNDGFLCGTDMADLTASGGSNYVWSTGANTALISVSAANTYEVTITDGNGCQASTNTVIAVNSVEIDAGRDTTICPGDTLSLLGVSATGLTYQWSPDSSLVDATVLVPRAFPDVTTKYFVTVTEVSGCTAVDSVTVVVHPSGTLRTILTVPSNFTTQDMGEISAVFLGGSNIVSIVWSPDTLLQDNTTNPVIIDPKTGEIGSFAYVATVVDDNNCEFVSDTARINIVQARPMAALSGTISTEEGEMVERATINLTDYDMPAQVTGATGEYGFQEIPMNGNYIVSPEKDRNPLNGVSTYDLVLISKHILGISPLDSPYKMIAGDINHSGTITAYDMVQLRQLILNINTDFANNTSWRFVDAAYEFSDPTNPFSEAIPETYTITDLTVDMTWLDFIAVKIGDVNNSAVVNNLMATESRSTTKSLDFQAKQGLSDNGQYLIFDFTANNFNAISGYQFALQFDPQVIAFDQIVPSQWVSKENFGLSDIARGQIATSWNQAEGLDIPTDEILFSLIFQLNGEVTSDELLEIVNTDLQAEAYDATGELLNVQLVGAEIAPQVAAKSIQLFQNRPNPFTGKTTIGFSLPEASKATLRIFDTAGKMIQVYDGYYEKGYNELIISSQELTQYGALYYQLATPTQVATMKMIHAQ